MMYDSEIQLARKLKQYLNIVPVLGFNSSGYDLPPIKNYLFDILVFDYGVDPSLFKFIKKQSKYVTLRIPKLSHKT